MRVLRHEKIEGYTNRPTEILLLSKERFMQLV